VKDGILTGRGVATIGAGAAVVAVCVAVLRPVPCKSDVVGGWGDANTWLPAPRTDGGAFTGSAVVGTIGGTTGAAAARLETGAGTSAFAVISERDGPPDTGFGPFISGVPKALNKACSPFAPCVKLLNALLPTFEICDSSTGANPSVLVVENALEAYSNSPIIPNKISIVVPGFMAS